MTTKEERARLIAYTAHAADEDIARRLVADYEAMAAATREDNRATYKLGFGDGYSEGFDEGMESCLGRGNNTTAIPLGVWCFFWWAASHGGCPRCHYERAVYLLTRGCETS